MVQAPKTHARPLDVESAIERAAQISALADADRLRVLSAIATAPTEALPLDSIARRISMDADEVAGALDALGRAGLVIREADGAASLTADAWVRFGRVLIAGAAVTAAPAVQHNALELPAAVQRIALDLQYRYSSVFSPETVRRYVGESYALLSERARITTYLPTLTARFATDRLSALATSRGVILRGTPEVLFVCVHNAGRSQMASAALRHMTGSRVHVRTAGSVPASRVDPAIVEVLEEVGVAVPLEFPKPLTDEVVQASDYVITMGCGDACPVYPGRRYMDWPLADPAGKPKDVVRRVRDEVFSRVERLVSELRVPAVAPLPSTSR